MIGISKLYCGTVEASDPLRYGHGSGASRAPAPQRQAGRKPVVVWNTTRRCNLACRHCYSASSAGVRCGDELSTAEGKALIDDLAAFGAPVLLLSGGEPLCRGDILELANYAASAGLRVVVSTNGTLIDAALASELAAAGVAYVGVSIDGMERTHDEFRRKRGAFAGAMAGIRACRGAGVKVGLRFTVTRGNMAQIPGVFELMDAEQIPRVCFYHLVGTGRGAELKALQLSHAETRCVVDAIVDGTAALYAHGVRPEVLTVANNTDGPYLYLRLRREGRTDDADKVMRLLRLNGGNSSGQGIACVSWDGTIYPDQFWRTRPLGTVRQRPFSAVWSDPDDPLLCALREKAKHVTGRCAVCRFLDVCGGNMRARAEAATGLLWGCDPACYLSNKEIGIEP